MGKMELLILLMGCISQDDPVEVAIGLFRQEPTSALEYVEKLDPATQLVVVGSLAEIFPREISPLCGMLPSSPTQARCQRLNSRPHLWMTPSEEGGAKEPPKPEVPELEALEGPCNLSPHSNTCRSVQADRAVREGDYQLALSACQSMDRDRWKQECSFHISEVILRKEPDNYQASLDACALSGEFIQNCWRHGPMLLSQFSMAHERDWSWHKGTAEMIRRAWADLNPDLGEELADHFWAKSIFRHFESGITDSDSYPAEAQHHYRACKAAWALRHGQHPLQELDRWLERLVEEEELEQRNRPRGYVVEMDLWEPREGVSTRSSVSYMGHSQRLYEREDIEMDWMISLLEAAARIRPLSKNLLEEGRRHEHPAVKATAERLLEKSASYKPVMPPKGAGHPEGGPPPGKGSKPGSGGRK
jgi:hypothetical protein